ncbi:hypothetical protein [Larkinella terrae]|uniref:Uncharacterized protein n=1 Tax=Larkinella terrae TaxID=2025311 RepID=A0A7K0EJH4_9BACT|nr:hypothetical protein [Larkinella terrae]MRS61892.1 hypothetical protein [Larkinella terrae]
MTKKLSIKRAKRLLKIDESKLDRYLQFYANETTYEDFTESEQQKLEQYSKAWGMLRMGRTEDMVRSVLMKDYAIQDRMARYLVEECKLLFGAVEETDKEGRRQASIAYYDLLSNIAFKEKDIKEARECRREADELAGLYQQEVQGLDPVDFQKPGKYVFINNVNVYKKQQGLEWDE